MYFEDEPGRRSAAHLLTRDEAEDSRQHRQTAGAAAPLADPTLPPCTTAEEAAQAAGNAMSRWRAADVFARAAAQLCDFCAARHRHSGIRDYVLGSRCWRKVMNTTFQPYRAPAWSGLKRYFVEWRKRALIRRELRALSDRQSWEDIIPPTPAHDV